MKTPSLEQVSLDIERERAKMLLTFQMDYNNLLLSQIEKISQNLFENGINLYETVDYRLLEKFLELCMDLIDKTSLGSIQFSRIKLVELKVDKIVNLLLDNIAFDNDSPLGNDLLTLRKFLKNLEWDSINSLDQSYQSYIYR